MKEVTRTAIKRAGGAVAVAREFGLTRQAVAKWEEVPAERVLVVERLSGVSRYELRPDIYGEAPPPRRPTRRAEARV